MGFGSLTPGQAIRVELRVTDANHEEVQMFLCVVNGIL